MLFTNQETSRTFDISKAMTRIALQICHFFLSGAAERKKGPTAESVPAPHVAAKSHERAHMMSDSNLRKKFRLALAPGARERGIELPKRKPGDEGWNIAFPEETTIQPGDKAAVESGIMFVAPDGWYVEVVNRTSKGMAGIFAAAIIYDRSYRGKADDPRGFIFCVRNVGNEPVTLKKGEAPCQIVLRPCWDGEVIEVEPGSFEPTERGAARYGMRDDGTADPFAKPQ